MHRPINLYCLPMLIDCTPYLESDFDPSVREFCRQKQGIQNDQHNNDNHHQSNKLQTPLSRFEPPLLEAATIPKPGSQKPANVNNSNAPISPIHNHHYASIRNVPQSCKVIVTGDVAVGKTSLINRFGYDLYSSNYKTTIGVDFDVQKFRILGLPYVLQIWDTAGLERFKCITSSYYRGCQVAIIVFDMSNLETLKNAIKWRDEIIESCQTFDQLHSNASLISSLIDEKSANNNINQKNVTLSLMEKHNKCMTHQQQALSHLDSMPIIFLVGSKSDLTDEINLNFVCDQAKIIANRMQAELWIVSAQTGRNVNELFTRIATLSFNKAVLKEMLIAKYEASTLGICLKQKVIQQQKDLWSQGKLIRITRKKKGDANRTKCVNIQCVIK